MTSRPLYSIGYEKTLLRDVVGTLTAAGVATLIDVRDRPISRRPGFSKRQLAAAVEEAGMRYVHLQALGTPPEGRLANRRREWDRFWGIVEERLAGPEAELALREAADLARAAPSCLLLLRSRLADLSPPPDRRDPLPALWLCGIAPDDWRRNCWRMT